MGHLESRSVWTGGLGFESQIRQHKVQMDANDSFGGKDQGPTPKEILLASICCCSGMDVVSLLQKMRQPFESCVVNAITDTTGGHPSIFAEVKLRYEVQGADLKVESLLKSVRLSMTKYCGVSAMVSKASPMSYEVILNGQNVGTGVADFSEATEK